MGNTIADKIHSKFNGMVGALTGRKAGEVRTAQPGARAVLKAKDHRAGDKAHFSTDEGKRESTVDVKSMTKNHA